MRKEANLNLDESQFNLAVLVYSEMNMFVTSSSSATLDQPH